MHEKWIWNWILTKGPNAMKIEWMLTVLLCMSGSLSFPFGKIAFIFFKVEYTHNWMLFTVKVNDKRENPLQSIIFCENLKNFVARCFYSFINKLESTKSFLLRYLLNIQIILHHLVDAVHVGITIIWRQSNEYDLRWWVKWARHAPSFHEAKQLVTHTIRPIYTFSSPLKRFNLDESIDRSSFQCTHQNKAPKAINQNGFEKWPESNFNFQLGKSIVERN